MADPKNKGKTDDQDQSMEEILQSIRRIIAEEGDDTGEQEGHPPSQGSDILELTDVIREDGAVENIDSKESAPMPESKSPDVLKDIDRALTSTVSSRPDPGEGLLSQESAFAAAAALKVAKEIIAPKAAAPAANVRLESPAFRSGNTVEDLVMEALRPMLKDWLDSNLKGIIERLVEKEIKRIVALNAE